MDTSSLLPAFHRNIGIFPEGQQISNLRSEDFFGAISYIEAFGWTSSLPPIGVFAVPWRDARVMKRALVVGVLMCIYLQSSHI
jgi:hypothetical protein